MKGRLYPKSSKAFLKIDKSITTDVLVHGAVLTVEERAKTLRSSVDHMITLAKTGTLAARREAAAHLRDVETKDGKPVLQYLFDDLAKRYKDRQGGYTRIIKAPNRKGDNSKMAIIELV